MMQEELPQYLQNMLLACGYDRLQTIMNVNQTESSQPNHADKMLDYVYIRQTFPSDSRLAGICMIDNIWNTIISFLDFVKLNKEVQYLIYLLDIRI